MKQYTQQDNQLIDAAYEFLLGFEGVTREIIEKQLIPDKNRVKPESLNGVYKSILESAQNVQRSPNVIGKAVSGIKGNIDPLAKLTDDFSPTYVLSNYANKRPEDLLDIIQDEFNLDLKNGNAIWLKYCKSMISAASFLCGFESASAFYDFLKLHYNNEQSRSLLPILLSLEIYGFGYALACDFLKELGYIQYGKPDTHIKGIFMDLGFMEKKKNNSSLQIDFHTQKIINRIAQNTDKTPYAIDKLLWLIGSGDFYLSGVKIGNQKKAFIEAVLESKTVLS